MSREGAEVTSAGRAFQTQAPATEKARHSLYVILCLTSVCVSQCVCMCACVSSGVAVHGGGASLVRYVDVDVSL